MTEHDVLVGFRLRLFTLAEELGNVSAACRAMGVDRSTYYRLKKRVDRWGLEALNVRERRRPRMPNQIGPHLERRIIAFALGHPGYGPRRISAELARAKWGGHHDQRARRVAGAVPRGPEHPHQAPGVDRPPPRSLRTQARSAAARSAISTPPSRARRSRSTASTSGGCRGPRAPSGSTPPSTSPPPTPGPSCTAPSATRAHATRASCCTASPPSSPPRAGNSRRSPPITALSSAPRTSAPPSRSSAPASASSAPDDPTATAASSASSSPSSKSAGAPRSPRSLVPKKTALARDLDEYLIDYNYDRAHTGRLTQGRVPADIVYGARKTSPGR